ncbi:MAG: CNNM domain-containing protein, partial [Chloroflexota bacterium]
MAVSVSFLIIIIAMAGSAFISASEAAVLAANRFRIRHMAEGGDGRASTLLRITDEHDRFFGTLLLIGNLFNILISTVGTSLAISLWGNTGGVVAGATLAMTVVVVIGGELTPKSLATATAERWALLVSRVIWWLMAAAGPLVWIFTLVPRGIVKLMGGREAMTEPMVTPGELRMLIDLGEAEGTVEESQGKMLENIFRFAETEARHVMTPRNGILAVTENSTVGEFLEMYAGVSYSRFPVYRDDLDDIIGILTAKDVLRALADGSARREDPVSELARPALFVPE